MHEYVKLIFCSYTLIQTILTFLNNCIYTTSTTKSFASDYPQQKTTFDRTLISDGNILVVFL